MAKKFQRFSPQEDALLKQWFQEGRSLKWQARELQRSTHSVKGRRNKLGLTRSSPWTPETTQKVMQDLAKLAKREKVPLGAMIAQATREWYKQANSAVK